ncbi:MAG: hypothetical protein ACLSHR_11635 [Oscillospiraceae bacterium]
MRLCQEEWNALDDICRTEKPIGTRSSDCWKIFPDRKLPVPTLSDAAVYADVGYRDAAEKARQNGLPVSNSRISQILLRIEKLPHDSQK